MRLEDPAGWLFEMRVQGYEFPDSTDGDYDPNWLLIAITVQAPAGAWQATDPALLTWEGARLADWLAALGAGASVEPDLGFIEPNLAFAWVAGGTLRVGFWIEFRPPWVGPAPKGRRYWLDLAVTPEGLTAAAAALRADLARFPTRSGQDGPAFGPQGRSVV